MILYLISSRHSGHELWARIQFTYSSLHLFDLNVGRDCLARQKKQVDNSALQGERNHRLVHPTPPGKLGKNLQQERKIEQEQFLHVEWERQMTRLVPNYRDQYAAWASMVISGAKSRNPEQGTLLKIEVLCPFHPFFGHLHWDKSINWPPKSPVASESLIEVAQRSGFFGYRYPDGNLFGRMVIQRNWQRGRRSRGAGMTFF